MLSVLVRARGNAFRQQAKGVRLWLLLSKRKQAVFVYARKDTVGGVPRFQFGSLAD